LIAEPANKPQTVVHLVTKINAGILAAGIAPAFFYLCGKFVFVRLFGNDVDHAADGIAAIQRRKCTGYDFNTCNIFDKRNSPVHFPGTGILDRLAVEQNERFGLIDSAQRHAACPYGALRLAKCAAAQIEAGHLVQHIAEPRSIFRFNVFGIDYRHCGWGIGKRSVGSGRRYYYLV